MNNIKDIYRKVELYFQYRRTNAKCINSGFLKLYIIFDKSILTIKIYNIEKNKKEVYIIDKPYKFNYQQIYNFSKNKDYFYLIEKELKDFIFDVESIDYM